MGKGVSPSLAAVKLVNQEETRNEGNLGNAHIHHRLAGSLLRAQPSRAPLGRQLWTAPPRSPATRWSRPWTPSASMERLLVSPYSLYGFDPTYALEVYAKHPTRYRLIKPFDPHAESVVDEFAEWARTPGVVGGRIMLNRGAYEPDDPRIDRLFDAAARAGVPLNVMAAGKLPLFRSYAERHPDTRLVIDHVGMITYNKPPIPDEPFADLPLVLSLADLDHVVIKISAACTLSHQPFPYSDIWEPLRRLFDAYGIDRCMWGTDWTRTSGLLTYQQGVEAFRV